VDIDSSGQIDYEEFVAAFKIKDNASSTGQTVMHMIARMPNARMLND
jgi:Ca2+-binding EF-hand superfamily protein